MVALFVVLVVTVVDACTGYSARTMRVSARLLGTCPLIRS